MGVVNLLISDTGESDIRRGVLTPLQVGCSVLYMETTKTYYSVKGTTSDVTTCGVCGREELRRTVVLHQHDYESKMFLDVVYAGTDCASRVVGCPQHEMAQRSRNADKNRRAT